MKATKSMLEIVFILPLGTGSAGYSSSRGTKQKTLDAGEPGEPVVYSVIE